MLCERPVTVGRLGCHPLGNLMILSIAEAFGDLAHATESLDTFLGISGRVLPATAEPVCLVGEADRGAHLRGNGDRRSLAGPASALRPRVPGGIPGRGRGDRASRPVSARAPGSLFTSVIATSALPTVASALARTPAPVVWISRMSSPTRSRRRA